MDSSDGPIVKPKQRFGGQGNQIQGGKSGVNNLMSGESFGMNPYRMARGALNPQRESKNSDIKSRQLIDDNFLEVDDDESSIRASRESGEIDWK